MASRESSMSGMASVRATLYNVFMRRTSTYAIACVVGSYAASHMYWKGTDSLWKAINRGKSWEELEATLPPKVDDDED